MEYTPSERLARIWELVLKDPDCMACLADMQLLEDILAKYTDGLSVEEQKALWAFPVSVHVSFNRVLEVVSRELRLQEEA